MRVLLTGAGGMLASAIAEVWPALRPGDNLMGVSQKSLDLRDATATRIYIDKVAPDAIIHTAAFVGGIEDKVTRPLPYLLDNLRIDTSIIDAAVNSGVETFLYMSSAAVYPTSAPNPISEDALFNGPLEPANEGYGLAKLAGLTAVRYAARQTGRAFRALLPSNLYGPHDRFQPERSHLVASALRKAHQARMSGEASVGVWGDGTARREFTYANDLAHWIADSIDRIQEWPEYMNVGAGSDSSIREYYEQACAVVGFTGNLEFDAARPSGASRRLLDSSVARSHGWSPSTELWDGMAACYRAFRDRSQNEDCK